MFDMRMRRITPVFVDDCVRDTAPVLVATGYIFSVNLSIYLV